jgi:hypothetical protein
MGYGIEETKQERERIKDDNQKETKQQSAEVSQDEVQ